MNHKFRLQLVPSALSDRCPYRLLNPQGREIPWACRFLDAQHIRGLSSASLRAYGYDLLNVSRWLHDSRSCLSRLHESHLLSYVRYQLSSQVKPSPSTVNHRLVVLRCLYRFLYGRDIPATGSSVLSSYKTRPPLGYGKPHRRLARLRLKQPRRVVVPLSAGEVSLFWSSFRTFRDLSIVALMLFNGLRSRETIQIQLQDLRLTQRQIRVQGKGRRERIIPLADETLQIIQRYLCLERPRSDSPYLFLSLKGHQRGRPMTGTGLRSLFRHHRRCSTVVSANAHRFRHTFGSDMVRAGLSLPALMRLMGHSDIQTTMLYVELSREDLWSEYLRAVERRSPLPPSQVP